MSDKQQAAPGDIRKEIGQLRTRLADTLRKDRFSLKKKLHALETRFSPHRWQKVQAQFQASVDRKQARARLPVPEQWPDLPVVAHLDELKAAIDKHQVVIVAGETGSGKTTQLPKVCLALGRGVDGMIGHTQPRRLAARAVSSRLAEELGCRVGERVGYKVRFTDQVSEETQVKVLTDGMLLAEIQQDRFLDQYDTLIIDEAHERSLNIDFLLGYVHQLVNKRPDLKVIITSATIDHERFSAHFGGAPVIEVSGRTYPVEVKYFPPDQEQDFPRLIEQVLYDIEVLERKEGLPPARDVLVFFSGEREIREAHRHLKKCEFRDTEFLPLYARLNQQEQQRIFSSHRGRRVVLSTNVAETSLTVPGIRYVIDTGMARVSRYSIQSKVQQLPIEPVSQASANQRKGRSGRVMPGLCYRLYSEEDFLSRPEFTQPEIHRTNLASVILQMENLNLGKVDAFPFIDPPDGRLVRDGFRLLRELGALDTHYRLTETGRKLARFPLDPRLGKMLLCAQTKEKNALAELLIIVSALSVQDPRERPHDKQQQADQAHAQFKDKQSDFVVFLNVWKWAEQQREALTRNQYEKILKKNFISPTRMREWRDTHRQLLLLSRDQGWKLNQHDAEYESVHRALMAGLLANLMKRTDEGEWLSTRNRKPVVWPGSALSKTKASWLMAAEQIETSRLFARCVAVVQPEWIEQEAAHLIKRQYFEPYWSKKAGAARAKEQVSLFGLIISSGKRVAYSRIDPAVSRELMVREGLVDGQLVRAPGFVEQNRRQIEKLEEYEHKLRKRDVLVDEEERVQFYLERIPESVCTLRQLEHWYQREASEQEKHALVMQDDFLLKRTPDVFEDAFPVSISFNGVEYSLEYSFDPAGSRDGVSIRVPVEMLNQLSQEQLDWLVPGLLREKIEALMRGLPKARRRHFVPVPDYVNALMQGMTPRSESLFSMLTRELQRMTGVRVELEEWQSVTLDPYLAFNIVVLDQSDSRPRVLAEGRDLKALQARFESRAVSVVEAQSPEQSEVYTRWDFGDLDPVFQAHKQHAVIRLWTGLQDEGAGVSVKHFQHAEEASWQHQWGMARLALLAMNDVVRILKKEQRKFTSLQSVQSVLSLPAGKLMDSLLLAAAHAHFGLDKPVYTQQGFEQVITAGKGDFYDACVRLLTMLEEVLAAWLSLHKKLAKNFPLAWAHAHRDIREQLEALVFPGFLQEVSLERVRHYNRYLQAVHHRLEKLGGQLGRDRAQTEELAALWAQYQQRTVDQPLHQQTPAQQAYRWMLEEYRVSLFAQHLGTEQPVSAKRLRKQWEEC